MFDEQRECDEAQSLQGPDGINLNCHLDVYYAIYSQVAETRQEQPFLNILQHLLRIDPKEAISDIIWDTAETLVHRATLIENREDSARLLRSPSITHFQCPHCRGDPISPNQRKQSIPSQNSHPSTPPSMPPSSTVNTSPPCAPAPPPPPPSTSAPPPPPPPMFCGTIPNAPPPAPPPNLLMPPSEQDSRSKTPECQIDSRLPQQETPIPKYKMKTINWNKIPPNKVLGRVNVWSIVADSHQNSPMADLDWAEMEGLFCQQQTSSQGSPKLGRDSGGNGGGDTLERKSRKENSEVCEQSVSQ